MVEKKVPFLSKIGQIVEQYPTPFHIYDERGIKENARKLVEAFSWVDGFREYFAVKAAPNPFLMKILKKEGFGTDCSSLAELLLANKCGILGENIMFTSNDTPAGEFKKAFELGAVINFDDISHISFMETHVGTLPELVSFRYNPGPLRSGNAIIGVPEEAKYGFTREQLFEGYKILKEKGVKRFGLHTMVASNELNPDYFADTAIMLFELVTQLSKELDISFEFVNMGGGFGIPYRPDQTALDMKEISNKIKAQYDKI
ncbi:MAG: hypothetical protein Q4F84_04795, partial [Fibrobacter sp.]|nr:hypothetical protein [Fibrobacter sp.]